MLPHLWQTKVKPYFSSAVWSFLLAVFEKFNCLKLLYIFLCFENKFNYLSPKKWTYKFGEVSMNHLKVLENWRRKKSVWPYNTHIAKNRLNDLFQCSRTFCSFILTSIYGFIMFYSECQVCFPNKLVKLNCWQN